MKEILRLFLGWCRTFPIRGNGLCSLLQPLIHHLTGKSLSQRNYQLPNQHTYRYKYKYKNTKKNKEYILMHRLTNDLTNCEMEMDDIELKYQI